MPYSRWGICRIPGMARGQKSIFVGCFNHILGRENEIFGGCIQFFGCVDPNFWWFSRKIPFFGGSDPGCIHSIEGKLIIFWWSDPCFVAERHCRLTNNLRHRGGPVAELADFYWAMPQWSELPRLKLRCPGSIQGVQPVCYETWEEFAG